MDFFSYEKIANLLKISIMITDHDGNILFQSLVGVNPISHSKTMKNELIEKGLSHAMPTIYRDEFDICYGIMHDDRNVCIVGPMATKALDKVLRHKYYKAVNDTPVEELSIPVKSEEEILNTISLLAKLFLDKEYGDEELISANRDLFGVENISEFDREQFTLDSEEEDIYRHSYQDERQLLDMVREGNIKMALELTRNMDGDIGKLSTNDLSHWKNLMVVATTLCARAAIEGGVAPYVAYRVSGFYINKGTSCDDEFKIITYRNQAVEELTRLVFEHKNQSNMSSYTKQCKDYVKKHYREKIYLDEIASSLGISESYLSRTFKKETGIRLQDYIIQIRLERAANLLRYSNESIPRIAEYVNFPSQSYLGKMFKEAYGLTPRVYRDKNKPAEFLD